MAWRSSARCPRATCEAGRSRAGNTAGDSEGRRRLRDRARAGFQDDPGGIVIDPDPAGRAEMFRGFFRVFVAASLSEGADLIVAGEPVEGVASWFGPERHEPSGESMYAHGLGGVLGRLGHERSQRMLAMTGEIERQHERLITGPHFRLEFFGVDPSRQGSGIGDR